MAITDHIGVSPSTICASILTGLSAIKYTNGTGVLRTLKRFVGPLKESDKSLIAQQTGKGLPGVLVGHSYGSFSNISTNKQIGNQDIRISLICICDKLNSMQKRLTNGNYEAVSLVGIEEVMDLALYYGIQKLNTISGIILREISQRWIDFTANNYVASNDIVVSRRFSVYEDTPDETFDKLGIVHSPTDYDDLWEVDNETPKSEWPSTTDGGVTTL